MKLIFSGTFLHGVDFRNWHICCFFSEVGHLLTFLGESAGRGEFSAQW